MCVVNILSFMNATPTVKIVLNKGKQIWKLKGKLSDNSLNKTKQIWKPKGKLFDNSLNKTKKVWKATGKLFANVCYQWRSTGKKVTLGKLNCGYQWRPTGKKFALGELCPLTKLSVQCGTDHPLVSGLRLFKTYDNDIMDPVTPGQLSSGLAPQCQMTLDHSSSSLNPHFLMLSAQISSGLAPQCLKMFEHSSSSLNPHFLMLSAQISSGLAPQCLKMRLLASLQAPFLKDKKALKESKKTSKRLLGTGGSNEGTRNILGVPNESAVVSGSSSEGTGSKPGDPDKEKLILEWEAEWTVNIHEWGADDEEMAYCNRVLERQKKLRNQIFRALTASADVPSSVTETTDTTSTLPPPPPPLQKPTGHRDIWEKVKDQKSRMHH
ncbi:hypothetical protein Tco_0818400 [Tanacetum coccineum]